jgi:hypothetical protein
LPLASIVEKYINYDKLQLGGNPKNRLYIRVFIVEKYPKKRLKVCGRICLKCCTGPRDIMFSDKASHNATPKIH